MAYNKLPLKDRLLRNAKRVGECLIWQGTKTPKGYGSIRRNGKWVRAHRVSYELHNGAIPNGMVIMHACDNRACIEPMHLTAAPQLNNVRDMLTKGRANKAKGERAPRAKLTQAQVDDIRRRYVPRQYGSGAHALAKEFGVSKQSVQAILRGDSWK